MFSEFALTPSIFDEEAQGDMDEWLDDIRELGAAMFPRVSASPVMVSNLYDGGWHAVAQQVVAAVSDHRARDLCQRLLTQITSTLVSRPACKDWPEDENGWVHEAMASAEDEAIDRIIATRTAQQALFSECKCVRSVSEVRDAGFWKGISASQSPEMRVADQVTLIRKLCLHSEFLCFLSPRIYGGSDDETGFAAEMIRSAFRRPCGYRQVHVEVHTEGPKCDPGDGKFHLRMSNLVGNISTQLRPALGVGNEVTLYVWPKLLDRFMIGGVYVEGADGTRERSPRWGISMQHIARGGDKHMSLPATQWDLLNRDSLTRRFTQYFKQGVAGFLPPSPVVITG